MSKVIYEMITNQIIEKLEQGVVPWHDTENIGKAVNWKTQKAYRGSNAFLIPDGEYVTRKQLAEAGGKLIKGEKYTPVIFWKLHTIEDQESGKEKSIPIIRFYQVYNIHQCTGIESKRGNQECADDDSIQLAEELIEKYSDMPKIVEDIDRTYYDPETDTIHIPSASRFAEIEQYYVHLFHELAHSTGHHKRLDRKGITDELVAYGDESYSREELIAELATAMLCGLCGMSNATIDTSATYIDEWIKKLKEDPKLIATAGAQAQKVCDYIQGITFTD